MSPTQKPTSLLRPRIACVGGFLGSGKTTAIITAAQCLVERGFRIGIITNDQGHELVDTALVRGRGLLAEEIGGGCFCCRFDQLAIHAQRLVKQHRIQLILAEAVGSCTDLAASVYRRLRQYYPGEFALAPLTVMVDPHRLREMSKGGAGFDENIRYLFGKQLAEADRVLLTKSDLLDDQEIAWMQEALREFGVDAPVGVISAQKGYGVNEWVEQILTERAGVRDLNVDYDLYGRAEASLGWLNANIDLRAQNEFHPIDLGDALMAKAQESCRIAGWAVAHVKIMLVTAEGNDWIALTESEGLAAWGGSHDLPRCREASMIINARLAADPEHLRLMIEECVRQLASSRGITATIGHIESFAPLPPKLPVFDEFRNVPIEN